MRVEKEKTPMMTKAPSVRKKVGAWILNCPSWVLGALLASASWVFLIFAAHQPLGEATQKVLSYSTLVILWSFVFAKFPSAATIFRYGLVLLLATPLLFSVEGRYLFVASLLLWSFIPWSQNRQFKAWSPGAFLAVGAIAGTPVFFSALEGSEVSIALTIGILFMGYVLSLMDFWDWLKKSRIKSAVGVAFIFLTCAVMEPLAILATVMYFSNRYA